MLRRRKELVWLWLLFSFLWATLYAGGRKGDMGIGFKAGFNRLEGDFKNPALKPFIYGNLGYNLNDFVSLGFEGGYSTLGDNDSTNFKTTIFPYEAHLTLNFFPLSKANIYAVLGGGGFYWEATDNDTVLKYPGSEERMEGVDSFIKAGGGVEFTLNKMRNLFLSIGATYRYSLTDWLDRNDSGDENDGIIDFYAGLTYYFRTSTRGDKDNDGVPDELDLSVTQAEDRDGYMDHDGKPDGVPHLTSVQESSEMQDKKDTTPPVVIHNPINDIEAGSDINIQAEIFENKELKVASVLYRPKGFNHWSVVKLQNLGGILYQGTIPGKFVRKQGLEYCVIAVDEAISGVGYCGLPKRPVNVDVIGNPKLWRILNGTAALLGWGTASYIILRKQK
ncbi:outer membrane beta-barrel protein [candidate division KSB1 bacterium]|nr:outer membrane beta-barrel protein [candidate division KSB1 bacterium]